mmetsp:Transcript_13874/g.29240  ORF Transcript_13874/g.29240 Transcript_13874/m.29240 type:complete len:123 (+) Transcript_13874:3-371(+)
MAEAETDAVAVANRKRLMPYCPRKRENFRRDLTWTTFSFFRYPFELATQNLSRNLGKCVVCSGLNTNKFELAHSPEMRCHCHITVLITTFDVMSFFEPTSLLHDICIAPLQILSWCSQYFLF